MYSAMSISTTSTPRNDDSNNSIIASVLFIAL